MGPQTQPLITEEERRRREAARGALGRALGGYIGSSGALGPGETDVRFGTGSTRPYVLQGMPEPTPTPTSAVASPPPMFGMTSPTAPMSQPAGMFQREAIPDQQSKPSDFLNYVESFLPAVAGLGTLGLDAIVPGLGTSLSVPVKEATNVAVKTARGKTKAAKDAATRGAANIAVDAGAREIAEASKEAAKAKAKAAGKTAEGAKAAGEAAEGTVDAAEDRAAEVVNRPGPSTVDAAADAKKVLAERAREDAMRKLKQDSLSLTGRERAELLNELTAEEARQERNYRRAITLAQSPELLDRMIESGGIGEETRANLAALGQAGLEEYDLFELGDPTSAGMRDSVKPLRGGFGAGAVSPLTGTLDYADPETRRRLQRMVALGAPREQAYVQMVEDMAPSQDVAPERTGVPEKLVTDAISPGRVFVPTAPPVSMDAAMARQALVEDPNMVNAAGTQADRILSAFDELPNLAGEMADTYDLNEYAYRQDLSETPVAGASMPVGMRGLGVGGQQVPLANVQLPGAPSVNLSPRQMRPVVQNPVMAQDLAAATPQYGSTYQQMISPSNEMVFTAGGPPAMPPQVQAMDATFNEFMARPMLPESPANMGMPYVTGQMDFNPMDANRQRAALQLLQDSPFAGEVPAQMQPFRVGVDQLGRRINLDTGEIIGM